MRALLCVVAAALAGCGSKATAALGGYSDAPFATDQDVRPWTGTSAPSMYFIGLAPSVRTTAPDGGDTNCPKESKSGNVTRTEGGCTDTAGRQWLGSMESVEDAPDAGTGRITYSKFGVQQTRSCNGQSVTESSTSEGSLVIVRSGDEQRFTVDIYTEGTTVSPSCATSARTSATSYSGSVKSNVWNGSGSTGNSQIGKVSAETKDETLGGSCTSEAESGTTTVKSGSNTVVITYDGATKCDATSTVKWSLNGVDKGEFTGVQCSSAAGLLPCLALLLARRRRRRQP